MSLLERHESTHTTQSCKNSSVIFFFFSFLFSFFTSHAGRGACICMRVYNYRGVRNKSVGDNSNKCIIRMGWRGGGGICIRV